MVAVAAAVAEVSVSAVPVAGSGVHAPAGIDSGEASRT